MMPSTSHQKPSTKRRRWVFFEDIVFFNLLKVMEDKLEMKQFRLFLRTLRMTYNFYEVLSFDYQKQCETEPNLGFQLRRLGRDPYNQQGRLPKGRNEVRRKRRKNSNLVSGKSLRSGWGRRTTGRRSSTASTWPTRRERTPFSLWYWSPTSMSYIWKDEDYEREWFHQIRMIDVGCYICSWAKDCISDKVSSLTCFCAGVLCLGRTQEHELHGQHGRQRLEYSQLFATLRN